MLFRFSPEYNYLMSNISSLTREFETNNTCWRLQFHLMKISTLRNRVGSYTNFAFGLNKPRTFVGLLNLLLINSIIVLKTA